jgi:hypothetical protein
MLSPNLHFQEIKEISTYETLLESARHTDVNDEGACDALLVAIEEQYHLGVISDEMVKRITRVLCDR